MHCHAAHRRGPTHSAPPGSQRYGSLVAVRSCRAQDCGGPGDVLPVLLSPMWIWKKPLLEGY